MTTMFTITTVTFCFIWRSQNDRDNDKDNDKHNDYDNNSNNDNNNADNDEHNALYHLDKPILNGCFSKFGFSHL